MSPARCSVPPRAFTARQRRVNSTFAKKEVLRHHAPGAEIQVAHLAVAHLPGGQSYGQSRRFEQSARIPLPERVPRGFARQGDRVPFTRLAVAPAVEDDQYDRALSRRRHLCSGRVEDYVPALDAPPKCTPLLTPLPAMRTDRLAILALLLPAALYAQAPGQGSITAATELRIIADGRVLANLRQGAPVQMLGAKSGWTQVAIEGWLHVSVLGPKRDSFPVSVKSPNGALMRATSDRTAAVVAVLADGMGIELVQRTDQWARVRRTGWVLSKFVRAGAPPAAVASAAPAPGVAPRPAPTAAAAPLSATPLPPDSLPGDVAVSRRTTILTAPSGVPMGTLDSATRLVTGASERGWVRVTLEGWVRQADLIPVDSAAVTAISAADLRAEPDRYVGRTVRWVVQVIALQTADPLRKGLSPDEPYLLARGPGSESSLLYLALPPSLMDLAKGLKPLSSVIVLAKVRVGKSEPAGVPILDLQRIVQR